MLKPSRNVFNGKLLSETHELKNPYSNKIATPQQRVDLKSFYLIGETEFEKYAEYNFLQRPSTHVPNKKKDFLGVTKTQVDQLEKDK